MAVTKTLSARGSKGHHTFNLILEEQALTDADKLANISRVKYTFTLVDDSNWYWTSWGSQISYSIVINGTTINGTIPNHTVKNQTIIQDTISIEHEQNGTKTVSCSFSVNDTTGQSYTCGTASASDTLTLTTIPRYTTISSFTVSKRNETSFTVNWQTADTVDYVWYSTNNGSTWTGVDVADGTSGSFTVSGLSPNTTYNCKLRVRRKDSQLTTDSSTVSQTTYKAPSQSLKSKTETSITMNWSCDTTANYIWYSIDNGVNWTAVGSVNATSGSYTINGLTANTSYNIKTRVRRSATSTSYDTTASSQTTYNYPYVSAVGTSALTIGNQQTLTLYNPLGRNVTVYMKKNNTSGTQLYSGTTNSTSITFTPTASTLYDSIPNSQSGNCVYYCTYSNQIVSSKSGTYKVIGTEIPTFTDFTYKDSNSVVTSITGNDQVMVKGLSTVQVTISSANKMVANNSATGNKYDITMGSLSASPNYSDNDIVSNLGIINDSGTQRINVVAFDSRELSKTVYKDVTVYDYIKPVVNATISRLNNFEAETTIKVNGTYTKLTINNINKNSISSVQYRYREVGSTWSSWVNLTTTVNNGVFTCSDVILSLDNTKSFEFEIRATDTLQQTTTSNSITLDIGQAIFFISSNNRTCYINNKEVLTQDYAGNVNIIGDITNTGNINNSGDVNSTGDITGSRLYQTSMAKTLVSGNGTDPVYWSSLPNGTYWHKANDNVTNLPSTYGFVTKDGGYSTNGGKGDFTALYFEQPTGKIYRTSGNGATTTCVWKELAYRDDILSSVYPVGSIYISVNNTNPSTYFGGTWSAFATGRTLVGVDTSQTEFNTVTKTGGEKTHKLTINEMPKHNHKHREWVMNGTSASGGNHYGFGYANNTGAPEETDSYRTSGELQFGNYPTGGDQAHNNLQPYITVYMWQRTA